MRPPLTWSSFPPPFLIKPPFLLIVIFLFTLSWFYPFTWSSSSTFTWSSSSHCHQIIIISSSVQSSFSSFPWSSSSHCHKIIIIYSYIIIIIILFFYFIIIYLLPLSDNHHYLLLPDHHLLTVIRGGLLIEQSPGQMPLVVFLKCIFLLRGEIQFKSSREMNIPQMHLSPEIKVEFLPNIQLKLCSNLKEPEKDHGLVQHLLFSKSSSKSSWSWS